MNRKSSTKYRKTLAGMLEQLDAEASTTVNGMRGEATAFPDPTDRAALESDRNLTLRIRDRERKLRNKINEALARIEEGTFGICEVCEEEISEERLTARPVTTLCILCKETQEEDEERHPVG
ncbi:MAG: RNA polymerase-binding protein DksA [SAR324 cluster bacterium]|nr:RNA polymerase-binding protein DksA [SAR324 cluster bacterium]